MVFVVKRFRDTNRQKILLTLLVILALAGCGAPFSPTPTPRPINTLTPTQTVLPTSGPNPLTGTYWNLILFKGQPLINGTAIVLGFYDEGALGGYAGCNWYHGPYSANNQHLRLVGLFAITVRGCGNKDLMAQEESYAEAFGNTLMPGADYRLTTVGSSVQLEIMDGNSQPWSVYEAISATFYQTLSQADPFLPH